MHLPRRDLIATGLVAVAALFYALWLSGSSVFGLDSTRTTGIIVLALGFAASATAVVPGFDQLIHGSRTYLAIASCIGLFAFGAGLVMLVVASDLALDVLMIAMAALWIMATMHHVMFAGPAQQAPTPTHEARHRAHPTGVA